MIFTAFADGRFELGGREVRCALGRSGVRASQDKREGDGATPLGLWPIRRVLYRPDRGRPPVTGLPVQPIAQDDGWCDAPDDAAYNRPVKRPYPAGCEAMWRDDGLYDLVAILAHNDDPPVAGLGSAIFLHVARPGYALTEGCVALARGDVEALLALAEPGSALRVAARAPLPLWERGYGALDLRGGGERERERSGNSSSVRGAGVALSPGLGGALQAPPGL